MATKPKAKAPAVPAFDMVTALGALVSATMNPPHFAYLSADESQPLVDAGFAEVNPEMIDAATGKLATRASQAGIVAAQGSAANQGAQAAFGTAPQGVAPQAAQTSPAASAAKAAFKLVSSIPVPESKRVGGGGGARPETYPFSTMEVGQAFFIAATADKPQPERSYASTVASARNRFAEEVPGQTRPNRKGKIVPVTVLTRDFVIRPIEDGGAAGFGAEYAGKKGAGVWRTK